MKQLSILAKLAAASWWLSLFSLGVDPRDTIPGIASSFKEQAGRSTTSRWFDGYNESDRANDLGDLARIQSHRA